MSRKEMQEVVQFAEANFPDATWNVYTARHWIVKDLADPRVVKEASIVEVSRQERIFPSFTKRSKLEKCF